MNPTAWLLGCRIQLKLQPWVLYVKPWGLKTLSPTSASQKKPYKHRPEDRQACQHTMVPATTAMMMLT
jgi:hypothetical protein